MLPSCFRLQACDWHTVHMFWRSGNTILVPVSRSRQQVNQKLCVFRRGVLILPSIHWESNNCVFVYSLENSIIEPLILYTFSLLIKRCWRFIAPELRHWTEVRHMLFANHHCLWWFLFEKIQWFGNCSKNDFCVLKQKIESNSMKHHSFSEKILCFWNSQPRSSSTDHCLMIPNEW